MSEIKNVICAVCDKGCPLKVKVNNNKMVSAQGLMDSKVICMKPQFANDYINHPQRLLYPLKNVGSRRGEQKWKRITWEQALDEIAFKLEKIIKKYGPESFAVSTLPVNAGVDQGMVRRLMNLLGSPNWMSGLSMCMGNTAQVHRTTLGWFPMGDYTHAKCIVYIGHNPHEQNWVMEYYQLLQAKERGAKLIVLDPRKSQCANLADLYLPLRYGTDAAMLLGWLNIIINEELYDKKFVKKWTIGFDELKERVQDYPLEKVAKITDCKAEDIKKAAMMYATQGPSIIPWSVNFDMNVNSTSLIRCHSILAAICGYLNKSEMLGYLNPDVVTISEVEMHEALPDEKKKIQLGTKTYPLFTYEGLKKLNEPSKRVYGREYCNVISSFMAHPPTVFKAMRTGSPYAVKAFFILGGNPLMGYANQQGVFEAMKNQELIVSFDHLLNPSAQLADYVLPGDAWLERPSLFPLFDLAPIAIPFQQALVSPGECKDLYFFIKGLADRLGLKEYFPWNNLVEFMEYRIQKSGLKWEAYEETPLKELMTISQLFSPFMMKKPITNKAISKVGFMLSLPFTKGVGVATPSGKVELKSSILEGLGYDSLPYYKEPQQTPISNPKLAKEYPLTLFIGLREGPYYNTNLRHVEGLRKQLPNPLALIHPSDAAKYDIQAGDWIWVETTHGKVKMMAQLDEVQPAGTIRVPHGWWLPELEPGEKTGFSGAMWHNDGLVISDDDWNLDPEQGLPNLRGGLLAKVSKI